LAQADKLIKQAAILILKVCISASLLYLLVSRVGGKTIVYNIRLLDPVVFISAVALYLIAAIVSTLRWKLLIPYHTKTSRLFSIYMIGSFFNTYMPGTIGGDAVKAYYLNKELLASKTTPSLQEQPSLILAIASIFMDRYIGLAALLSLGVAAFPFGIRHLEKASSGWPVIWIIPATAVIFAAASILIFKFRVGERLKYLLKFYNYFRLYSSKRGLIARAFIYSIVVQLLGILSVYIIARGLSLDAPFLLLIIFLPIIILVSSLPISISGIGLREGSFILLLGSIRIPAEKSLTFSIIWYLSVFVAGVWGLIEYLRFKTMFGSEKKEEPFQIP